MSRLNLLMVLELVLLITFSDEEVLLEEQFLELCPGQ